MQSPAHTDITNSLPQSSFAAFGLIGGYLGSVRELINKQLADCSADVGELFGQLNVCSGKMIRPGLVLLCGRACGGITDEHIRVAATLELIHNATLLHDDVIDEGRKRRHLPTINSLYGNESAVLLGDFLLSRAFKLCIDLPPAASAIIAATAGRTCEGELSQIMQRQNLQLTESQYIDIIAEKSAAFFSSACLLGASLADADETKSRLLSDYGRNLGIAFQITDDLLDIVGDESKTGKTLGTDVDKSKLTLALIHLLRTADTKERDAIENELNSASLAKQAITEMLMRFGSLDYAHSRAKEFTAKAVRVLAHLKESGAKAALVETAELVADRAI